MQILSRERVLGGLIRLMAYYRSVDQGAHPEPEDNHQPGVGSQSEQPEPDSPNESRVAEERVDYWPGMPDYPDRPRRVASRKPMRDKEPEAQPAEQDAGLQAPDERRRALCRPRMNRRRRPAAAQTGWWIPTPSGAYRRPRRRYALGRTRHQPSRQRRSLMPRPRQDPRGDPPGTSDVPAGSAGTTHSRTSCRTRAAVPPTYDRDELLPGNSPARIRSGVNAGCRRARAPRRHHRARCPVAASRALGGHIRQAP